MKDFQSQLSALCASELGHARRDADRMGVMIERLCDSLALTIAVACKGNHDGMDKMIAGADSHITVRAADHARFARILEGAVRFPSPPSERRG